MVIIQLHQTKTKTDMKNIKKKTNPTTRTPLQKVILVLIPVICITLFAVNENTISGVFAAGVSYLLLWLFTEPYHLTLVVLTEQQKEILRTHGLEGLRSNDDQRYNQISLPVVTATGKRGTLNFHYTPLYTRKAEVEELLLAGKLCISNRTVGMGHDIWASVGKIYSLDDISVKFAAPTV